MKSFYCKSIFFSCLFLIRGIIPLSAQYILNPEGDTLMIVETNGAIKDIGGNYMGKFESDGTIKNGQNILIGKIDITTGKIYDQTLEEIATLSNNQVLDYEQNLIATVQSGNLYDSLNNLSGSFSSLETIKSIFLLLYYF